MATRGTRLVARTSLRPITTTRATGASIRTTGSPAARSFNTTDDIVTSWSRSAPTDLGRTAAKPTQKYILLKEEHNKTGKVRNPSQHLSSKEVFAPHDEPSGMCLASVRMRFVFDCCRSSAHAPALALVLILAHQRILPCPSRPLGLPG